MNILIDVVCLVVGVGVGYFGRAYWGREITIAETHNPKVVAEVKKVDPSAKV